MFKLLLTCSLVLSLSLHGEEIEKKPHATIIVGTHHYSPQKTMPKFAAELQRLGFDVSLINPTKNPEKKKDGLPGLEVLKDTDVAIFFVRWLSLEGEQYQQIMSYVKAGKPVVCLRTSTHAFIYPKAHEKRPLTFSFGKDAFGTPYKMHLAGATKLSIAEGVEKHPILTGVTGEWNSSGTLYLTDLQPGATPLILGTGKSGVAKEGVRKNMYGTHKVKSTMTDSVAWTWKNKWGGKTFGTSLGHENDFAQPMSMRVLINGIHWAAGKDVPSAKTPINTFDITK